MAGRSWFAEEMLWPQSMGCWCLIILALGGCRGVLAADSPAMEPSAAGAHGEEGGCYHPLSDVIWGFLVTLLALIVSHWGSWKCLNQDTAQAGLTILVGVLAPLEDLRLIVEQSLHCVSLLWNCHKMEYRNSRIPSPSGLKFMFSSLLPWSKSPARILASCIIVVYVTQESPLLQKNWLWSQTCIVMDESEGMVVGENGARATRNHHYERKELSAEGLQLLLWKEVSSEAEESKRLPKYDELKYLRGNSGFAVIAIAMQAFGYIYAVGFRSAKNLRISPLEVIGLVFNIILLVKVFFYSTCNPCHRPLVIYMDEDWEDEVGEFNDNNQYKLESYDVTKVHVFISFGIFVGLITLLIYCIVNIVKATKAIIALPIIAFLLGLCLDSLAHQVNEVDTYTPHFRGYYIGFIGLLVNAIAYIWALVVTVLYWRTMHFNSRGEHINLSQIIPFIG